MLLQNPDTKEPYIPLHAPYDKIILTPPRIPSNGDSTGDSNNSNNFERDKAVLVSTLNHPAVYPNLVGPPYPYLSEHADRFLREEWAASMQLFPLLGYGYWGVDGTVPEKESGGKRNKFVGGCPFICIRMIQEGAEIKDILIGTLRISRWRFSDLPSTEVKEAQEENNLLNVGDERIIWEIGDILSPSHHGKGIMTAVIHALIHDFAVTYMNARTIKATTYVENKGSARVFEKNGFKCQCTLEDWADVPQNRGGGKRSIHVYVWKRDEE